MDPKNSLLWVCVFYHENVAPMDILISILRCSWKSFPIIIALNYIVKWLYIRYSVSMVNVSGV